MLFFCVSVLWVLLSSEGCMYYVELFFPGALFGLPVVLLLKISVEGGGET